MTTLGTLIITDKKGHDFEFAAYSWNEVFRPVGAVYVITKCIPELGGHPHHSLLYVQICV